MQIEEKSDQTLYDLLGQQQGIRQLVDRFYDLMAIDDQFANIRALHPADLTGSRDKLYWFLCGWSGGPNLYIERFGLPMLRARHLPYAIGISQRDQWLECMAQAMQDQGLPQGLFDRLLQSFAGTADWMRNQHGA
jgi:hemoglobin